MPLMNWSPSLSVGVDAIDGQHRKLVDLLNGLADAMSQGQGQVVLQKTLDELVSYTVTHFTHEEREMARTSYPDAAAHKKQHADLAAKAVEIRDKLAKDGKGVLTVEVLAFLKQWLVGHIQGTDKKLGAHIAAFDGTRASA